MNLVQITQEAIVNITLWIAQFLLAGIFAYSGAFKSVKSKAALVELGQTGLKYYTPAFIRFIAACELLAVIGLVVPWWTGIAPMLTPTAALGIAVIMVGAAFSHARLAREDPQHRTREFAAVSTNVFILGTCVFVAWGRLRGL
jgi:uncharacterized membrane protein YphA (DoxX/SURF4 family)